MKNIVIDNLDILQKINQDIYKIADKIYKKLGPGHSEFIYHRAFEIELRTKNINYETEKRVLIKYETEDGNIYTLGEERIDIYLPKEKIIIELKAMITIPKENEITQLKKYYRELIKENENVKYGLIINFPQSGSKEAKIDIDFIEIIF
jgi:GxxExxY protein